jgi:hypothetical protein
MSLGNHRRPLLLASSLTVPALLLASGCAQNGPSGNRGGRVDPGDTVSYEYRDKAAPTADLRQFAGQATEQIAQRLSDVPEIAGSPTKVVIALGAITNRTNTPTSDFVTIRRKVFTGLVNSSVRRYADIIEQPEIMQGQLDRYASNDGTGTQPGKYDPSILYVLQGEFGELQRLNGQVSDYYFDFTLTNLRTGKIVTAIESDGLKIDRRLN